MLRRAARPLLNAARMAAAEAAADVPDKSGVVPTPSTKEPWENLQGLLVSVKPTRPQNVYEDRPLAIGHLVEKVGDTSYRVRFRRPSLTANGGVKYTGEGQRILPPFTVEIGTRVKIFSGAREAGMIMDGLVVKINGNATYTVLMESNEIELSVSPESIAECEERTKILHNQKFVEIVDWLRSSIKDQRDAQAVAMVLFFRGWRVERLYLLEKSDVQPMVFISKVEKEQIMEKAQWERDHHNVVRSLHRERVKDRDWRYSLAKYKGTISCISGIFVVSYVFTANFRAYRRQQRAHQLKVASRTLANSRSVIATAEDRRTVDRNEEEESVREVLRQLDPAHPRIVVYTGFSGCGKSTVCRAAITQEKMPAVYVDIRGSEDTLRSVVKALGVQNVDVCGDLLDFVAEVCQRAHTGERLPLLVLKLREGTSLEKVYKEAYGLVSDHQVCHILFEVPMESLTVANMSLPRMDFNLIPNFSRKQAFEYTQYRLDPLDMLHFIEVVGTNSNDLDELYAAVRQRGVDPVAYTSLKLMRAMRRIKALTGNDPNAITTLQRLAESSFTTGLPDASVEHRQLRVLNDPNLSDIILFDPVEDRWLFTQQVFHSATRCFE